MVLIKTLCVLLGATLFLIAVVAHVLVRKRLTSKRSDLGEAYYEFEETDPAYSRTMRWYRWTLLVASASLLLLFIGVAI
jgi:hypothetical protein